MANPRRRNRHSGEGRNPLKSVEGVNIRDRQDHRYSRTWMHACLRTHDEFDGFRNAACYCSACSPHSPSRPRRRLPSHVGLDVTPRTATRLPTRLTPHFPIRPRQDHLMPDRIPACECTTVGRANDEKQFGSVVSLGWIFAGSGALDGIEGTAARRPPSAGSRIGFGKGRTLWAETLSGEHWSKTPSPLWGGLGRGVYLSGAAGTTEFHPPPCPSPRGGGDVGVRSFAIAAKLSSGTSDRARAKGRGSASCR